MRHCIDTNQLRPVRRLILRLACWINRSVAVGIPKGRLPPAGLGILLPYLLNPGLYHVVLICPETGLARRMSKSCQLRCKTLIKKRNDRFKEVTGRMFDILCREAAYLNIQIRPASKSPASLCFLSRLI